MRHSDVLGRNGTRMAAMVYRNGLAPTADPQIRLTIDSVASA